MKYDDKKGNLFGFIFLMVGVLRLIARWTTGVQLIVDAAHSQVLTDVHRMFNRLRQSGLGQGLQSGRRWGIRPMYNR